MRQLIIGPAIILILACAISCSFAGPVVRGDARSASRAESQPEPYSLADLRLVGFANEADDRLFRIEFDGVGVYDFRVDRDRLACGCDHLLRSVRFVPEGDPDSAVVATFDSFGLPQRLEFDSGTVMRFFWRSAADVGIEVLLSNGGREFLDLTTDRVPPEFEFAMTGDPDCPCAEPRLFSSGLVEAEVRCGGAPEGDAENLVFRLELPGNTYESPGLHVGGGVYQASFPVGAEVLTPEEWREVACLAVRNVVDEMVPPLVRGGTSEEIIEWVVEDAESALEDLEQILTDPDAKAAARLARKNIIRYGLMMALAQVWDDLEALVPVCDQLGWDPAFDYITEQVETPGVLSVSATKRYSDGTHPFAYDETAFVPGVGQSRMLQLEFDADPSPPACQDLGRIGGYSSFWLGNGGGNYQTTITYGCEYAGSAVVAELVLGIDIPLPGWVKCETILAGPEVLGHLPALQPGQQVGTWTGPVFNDGGVCSPLQPDWRLAVGTVYIEVGDRTFRQVGYCSECY